MVEKPGPKPIKEEDFFDGTAELERLLGLRPARRRIIKPEVEINQKDPTDEEINEFIKGKSEKPQPPGPVPLK